ncbi:MAG: 4-hydroxy-tetrahydrodipicolinate reductase [Deltaproteobacteria bacterium]|nr:4-hydroxy-tetrahydrodipicolinate reductase [Deltaproteobacteria bacterium]
MRIVIVGAGGRLGRELVRAVARDARFRLCGATVRADSPLLGRDATELLGLAPCGVALSADLHAFRDAADVLIDFTTPEATFQHASWAAEAGVPLVVGTTGLSGDITAHLRTCAARIAIVYSPNFSVGVNLLWHLASAAGAAWGASPAIEIEETHHIHKKDAPSGTAKRLHEVVSLATGRPREAISVVSHRNGEVVGDHCIRFDTAGETLTLTHHAKSRAVFADGAVGAAAWAVGRPAGWYGMDHVLGLTSVRHPEREDA